MTTDSKPVGGAPAADLAPFNATAVAASLTVKDIRKSLAWYRDVVGFTSGAAAHSIPNQRTCLGASAFSACATRTASHW